MTHKITAATTDAKFVAADDQMLKAEELYLDFERELQSKIDNVKLDYPSYHAYHLDVAKIGHDPYVLISILSAIKADFSVNDPEIIQIFNTMKQPRRQYTLTISKRVADEFADDYADAEVDEVDSKHVDIFVKLTNYSLSCTVDSLLNYDQLATYAGYLRSRGCRPDLFPVNEYPNARKPKIRFDYQVPVERLKQYPRLAKMYGVAKDLIGYPYVWGGSDLETSFDCSGFIAVILDQLGYKYRNTILGKEVRLPVAGSTVDGAFYDGLIEKCIEIKPDDREPGDLVFFNKTFDSSYRRRNLSHVGIYMGDDVFLACGEPYGVEFNRFSDTNRHGYVWSDILVCYGRLRDMLKEE